MTGPIDTLESLEDRADDEWQERQRVYWAGISSRYDELYRSGWSALENAWTRRRLKFLRELADPVVLDLGCGTGLGLSFVRHHNERARYVGLDISKDMVGPLIDQGERVVIGSMDDLGAFDNASVDVVISLFSSLSYADRTETVFAETARVLKPGGWAYFSVLSAHALSRWRAGAGRGLYQTRGDHRTGAAVPVREHTTRTMRRLGQRAGLRPVRITGMNLFSGLWEFPPMWRVGRHGARLLPALAHTIEAKYRKVQ
nr:hypothetical protein GCM10020063_080010 [Dactylosporangium thailandense]